MISIIICSRKLIINPLLTENISATIGCQHEFVIIDNSKNKYNIFQAYNLGIQKSVFNYVVFLHDDILFHSDNWGNIIHDIFIKNKNVGLIGVAGSKVKSKMPSGWWDCPKEFKQINIIQHLEPYKKEIWNYGFKNNSNLENVVAIDGVFIAMNKDKQLFFDDNFSGFHNYDLNISFECISKGFEVVATNQILIEHFSNGVIDNSWYKTTFELHKKYKNLLPLKTKDVSDLHFLKILELKNGKRFVNKLLQLKYKRQAIVLWFNIFLIKPFDLYHLRFFKHFLNSKTINNFVNKVTLK